MAVTIKEILSTINAFPIPDNCIERVCTDRGLTSTSTYTATIGTSKEFQLATADIYFWLSSVPNISQGGQSYSLSDSDKSFCKQQAQRIYNLYAEDTDNVPKATYGYKGSKL